jgi:hypothetical protein
MSLDPEVEPLPVQDVPDEHEREQPDEPPPRDEVVDDDAHP